MQNNEPLMIALAKVRILWDTISILIALTVNISQSARPGVVCWGGISWK